MRLSAIGLAIGYGRTEVGKDISLSVGTGEVLCLLGPNGCGKTTLFRTMLGLIPPLAGEIRFGDRPIGALSRPEIARHVAYVPQGHAPPFPFKVLDVVLMGRTSRIGRFAQPGRQDRQAAVNALETLGISELAEHDYSRLSGGQRQLVLIARALAQEASLIVMDEPTASLDFGNQVQVLTQIARLARSAGGHGIILSTHDPDQAFALKADAALMSRGRLAAAGPADSVLSGDMLSAVYGTKITVEITQSDRRVCTAKLQ